MRKPLQAATAGGHLQSANGRVIHTKLTQTARRDCAGELAGSLKIVCADHAAFHALGCSVTVTHRTTRRDAFWAHYFMKSIAHASGKFPAILDMCVVQFE